MRHNVEIIKVKNPRVVKHPKPTIYYIVYFFLTEGEFQTSLKDRA